MFVLKGRFLKRVSHAILVFTVWLCATQFYQYILAYYRKKEIFAESVAGVIFALIRAIVLAPLDRYVELLYSYMNCYSLLFACGLFVLFYAGIFFMGRGLKKQTKRMTDMQDNMQSRKVPGILFDKTLRYDY